MAGTSNFLGINTGTDAKRAATTQPGGISYVLAWITDTARLWFFDGATTGGVELALVSDLPSAGAPLSPTDGGTGVSNPTAHTIPVNEGSGAQNNVALADGQIIIGQSAGDPAAKAVSGDATLADTGALTLAASGVTAGSYSHGSFTVDAKGRLTVAASGATPLLPANNLADVANAATARGNLGAAASGANSDITSLTGLTTPLPLSEGGLGATGGCQAANNLSVPYMLSTTGVASSPTGDTNETVLAYVNVPANAMGANGSVAVDFIADGTALSSNASLIVRIQSGTGGGTGGTSLVDWTNFAAGYTGRFNFKIFNTNATNAQAAYRTSINAVFGLYSAALVTASIDTTQPWSISINGKLGSASDTIKLANADFTLISSGGN